MCAEARRKRAAGGGGRQWYGGAWVGVESQTVRGGP